MFLHAVTVFARIVDDVRTRTEKHFLPSTLQRKSRMGPSCDVNKKGPWPDLRICRFSSYKSGLDLYRSCSAEVRVIKTAAMVPRERDIG
jgi:hypothetical protein